MILTGLLSGMSRVGLDDKYEVNEEERDSEVAEEVEVGAEVIFFGSNPGFEEVSVK